MVEEIRYVFGPHLIIDGSRCNTRKLADRILVEQVLNDYPAAIGMTKIGGPYMFEYQAPDPAYSGVSGLVVIAESHIAIHTFPELDYFTMDIFSCKNFDHEKAIEYIRSAFDVQEMDRMLVQRGLSFKGPHHGRNGATDELIAAAEARLQAGIISKEPALPDDLPDTLSGEALSDERAALLARRASQYAAEGRDAAGGKMLWPQYGVTPDIGSYGDAATDEASNAADDACEPCVRGGATVVALTGDAHAPLSANGAPLPATEPVLVNPTASMSGLLDKMAATGGQGRALGLALAEWERLVRAPRTTIALTLSAPVIAEGMRELLVYSVEHGYVDSIVASSENLLADLYESLGYVHFASNDGTMVMSDEGRAHALTFFRAFLAEQQGTLSASTLWQRLGAILPTKAPRKGLLQAAAQTGTPIFTPDLGISAFGAELLIPRADGTALALDGAGDVLALAQLLASRDALGVVQCGAGAAEALLMQAQAATNLLGLPTPALAGVVALGAQPFATGKHAIAVRADASLALPLLVSGLAQRHPAVRTATATTTEKAPALA
jgi:S-adenosylmethionine decarboxylase